MLAPVAQIAERPPLERDLTERRDAAVAARRLRLETDLGLPGVEAEVADQIPAAPVLRSMKRKRRADPGDAEPDGDAVDDRGVAVVGRPLRDDRDDHRLALGRPFEREL